MVCQPLLGRTAGGAVVFRRVTCDGEHPGREMTAGSGGSRGVLLVAFVLLCVVRPAGAQVITEFPTLTSGSKPLEITAGPGGVWFTENGANRIGSKIGRA